MIHFDVARCEIPKHSMPTVSSCYGQGLACRLATCRMQVRVAPWHFGPRDALHRASPERRNRDGERRYALSSTPGALPRIQSQVRDAHLTRVSCSVAMGLYGC